MNLTITLNADGDDLSEGTNGIALRRILQQVPAATESISGSLRDINGNTVGHYQWDDVPTPHRVVDNEGDEWRRGPDGRWWCGVDDEIDLDALDTYRWLTVATLAELDARYGIREVRG